jgi:hypothetical protein
MEKHPRKPGAAGLSWALPQRHILRSANNLAKPPLTPSRAKFAMQKNFSWISTF